jgi:hypothetical protein
MLLMVLLLLPEIGMGELERPDDMLIVEERVGDRDTLLVDVEELALRVDMLADTISELDDVTETSVRTDDDLKSNCILSGK